jgi:hypothetical protein
MEKNAVFIQLGYCRDGSSKLPFRFIGKEIERKAQKGEDIRVTESTGPIRYEPRQTTNTRVADPPIIVRAKRYRQSQLRHESGVSQHALERFLDGKHVHPGTRNNVLRAVENLERRDLKKKIIDHSQLLSA